MRSRDRAAVAVQDVIREMMASAKKTAGKNETGQGAKRKRSESDEKPGTSATFGLTKKKKKLGEDEDSVNGARFHFAIHPVEMRKYVKSMLTRLNADMRKDPKLHKCAGLDQCDYVPPSTEVGLLETELTRYVRYATSSAYLRLRVALSIVDDLLSNPDSLQLYPDFPTKPRNAYQIFMARNMKASAMNDDTQTRKMQTSSKEWKENPKVQEAFAIEASLGQKHYVEELDAFEKRHSDELDHSFRLYVQKLRNEALKAAMKRSTGETVKTPKKTKGGGEPRKTPFDYFKQTMKNKYADMDEERRTRKLLRRFEKLDEKDREIYESLAENQ